MGKLTQSISTCISDEDYNRSTNLQEGAIDVILSLATIGYGMPYFQ